MLNRFSVNAVLKTIIAALSALAMAMLTVDAWSSWHRVGAARRISAAAEASAHLFTALHNLRVDRAQTNQDLLADRIFSPPTKSLVESRAAEMPALSAGLAALANTSFSVLTPGGDVIRELVGAFPSLVLAEGEYVVIARRDGKTFQKTFTVQSALDQDVEVIAK